MFIMKIDFTKPLSFFKNNKLKIYLFSVCLLCPLLPIIAHIIINKMYIYLIISPMISISLFIIYQSFIGKYLHYIMHMKVSKETINENKDKSIR